MSAVKVSETVMIPIDDLHPNEWNPNEQSTVIFNELSREIEQDGFDVPLHVVYWEGHEDEKTRGAKQYKIIDGEHRWRIGKLKQMEKLPCIIHENWDEYEQMIKTVRRNLLTGDLNPAKFTELIHRLEGRGFKPREQYRELGFESYEEMAKHFAREREEKAKAWADALASKAEKESDAVSGLSDILNTIFRDCGDTVDKNYMFFTHKGQLHMMCIMDPNLYKLSVEMEAFLRSSGMNINQFLFDAIKRRLEASKPVESSDEDIPVPETAE